MAFNDHRWRTLGAALGLAVLAVCMLLYLYYPTVPHSVLGWITLIMRFVLRALVSRCERNQNVQLYNDQHQKQYGRCGTVADKER